MTISETFLANTEEKITDAILRFWPDADDLTYSLNVYVRDQLLTVDWINNVAPHLEEFVIYPKLVIFLKEYKGEV